MKSNYKKLGNYIELVSCLNNKLQYGETDVRGVSNNKEIIETRANNEGRDFNTFFVVKPEEFVYNSRTSRMGDKVGLGYNDTKKTFITSFNNTVFRVKDEALLPMFLYMWFNRPEFDRYVRFHSWGSSTEIFSWEEMCNTLLPIPRIDMQKGIVKEFNIIVNRIKLNNQLIKKLEETAEAIYKQWFVDFEFPNENGQPYKSNGGEMGESELGEIPKGWKVGALEDLNEVTSGKTPFDKNDLKTEKYNFPIFGAGGIMGFSSKNLFDKKLLSIGRVGTHGIVQRINYKCWASDNTLILTSNAYEYTYQILLNINYDEINRGGVQGLITQTDIKNTNIIIPNNIILKSFEKNIGEILLCCDLKARETEKLEELKSILLSKLATIEN